MWGITAFAQNNNLGGGAFSCTVRGPINGTCSCSCVGVQNCGIQDRTAGVKMASRASLEYDYLFKIVLVGDAAVGKTNLLACYTSQVCVLSSPVPESFRLSHTAHGSGTPMSNTTPNNDLT